LFTILNHDPENFREISKVEVKMNGKKVTALNELEYINGEVWANIYESETIVIINPATGEVRATVDCKGLLPLSLRTPRTAEFNGIAYNPANGHIYVTGKYWPKMYRIELVKK
jgi:glutamine cyclotransferase